MFNKTKNYLKKKAKNVMSSGRLKAMALMGAPDKPCGGLCRC